MDRPPSPEPSIASDQSAVQSQTVDVPLTKAPCFDLDASFPAILAPYSLLHRTPESQDVDALRALAPVFCNCLDEILHSMDNLPDHISASPKYTLALSSVRFSRDTFLGHATQLSVNLQPASRREAICLAMHYLDTAMSALKGLLDAAAYEVAQLKPLPQIPVEDDRSQVSYESSPASVSRSRSSVGSRECDPDTGASAPSSTSAHSQPLRSKVSTLFRQLSLRPRAKPRLDLSGPDSAVTLVNDDSGDLSCGYVNVAVNIRNSLAQFPVSFDLSVGVMPHPEDSTELWKDRNGFAQLASLKALVRYMTSPDADGDVEIIDVFFLCFRFFSSPKETFDALVARYDEDMDSYSMQVKTRVAKLLYFWVDLHWRAEDAEVLSPLTQFTFSRLSQDIPEEASSKLVSVLHKHACAGEHSRGFRMEKTIAHAAAKHQQELLFGSSWVPQEKKSMMRGDYSKVKIEHFFSSGGSTMIALQLTLLLWEKYRAFEPEDAVRYLMFRKGDDNSEIACKVSNFMAYEKAVHRFVMNNIGTAEMRMRSGHAGFFLELASCHELRNFSASCLISLACDRPSILPFITKLKLSPIHERMRTALRNFYTRENQHMAGYKQALQSCCCPALPGMMLFIREVARGCGSEPFEKHPTCPGSPLINLKRYRPLTWAIRAMEKCHAPFRIQRVDYICNWLEHVLSDYLVGTETEWEERIYSNCLQSEVKI